MESRVLERGNGKGKIQVFCLHNGKKNSKGVNLRVGRQEEAGFQEKILRSSYFCCVC